MTKGGVDYVSSSGTLSFDSRNLVRAVSIFVRNDSILEFDEIFQVDLSGGTNGVITHPSSATITIIDDDSEYYSLQYYIGFV